MTAARCSYVIHCWMEKHSSSLPSFLRVQDHHISDHLLRSIEVRVPYVDIDRLKPFENVAHKSRHCGLNLRVSEQLVARASVVDQHSCYVAQPSAGIKLLDRISHLQSLKGAQPARVSSRCLEAFLVKADIRSKHRVVLNLVLDLIDD